jgi:toxin secretion/phage lysis holin
MKVFFNSIQLFFIGLGGFFGWALGGWDGFMIALVAFVSLDYITGVIAAIYEKKLNSEIGYKGILKKILIFIVVFMANIIDTQLIQNGSAVRTAIIFFYVYNEGISILENVSRTGLPVSVKLKEVLEQINGKGPENKA